MTACRRMARFFTSFDRLSQKLTSRRPWQLKWISPAVMAETVICVLFRPVDVLWDLDWGPGKSIWVLRHPCCQTIAARSTICAVWTLQLYCVGSEMGLARIIAAEMGDQRFPECLGASQFISPFVGTKGPRPHHEKHTYTIMLPPLKIIVGTMLSDKKRSPGICRT